MEELIRHLIRKKNNEVAAASICSDSQRGILEAITSTNDYVVVDYSSQINKVIYFLFLVKTRDQAQSTVPTSIHITKLHTIK